jgi:DNA-binding GntR family transcriptional regulator
MKAMPVPSSLSGKAYEVIRGRILRGELAIGQVISRRKIAAEMGMSFLPITAAFQALQLEGLVESRPRTGTRVRIFTAEDVKGHYIVREGLEVQAAKCFNQNASREHRTELLTLAAQLDSLASRQHEYVTYFDLHATLHERISTYACCSELANAIHKTCALPRVWSQLPQPGGRMLPAGIRLLWSHWPSETLRKRWMRCTRIWCPAVNARWAHWNQFRQRPENPAVGSGKRTPA